MSLRGILDFFHHFATLFLFLFHGFILSVSFISSHRDASHSTHSNLEESIYSKNVQSLWSRHWRTFIYFNLSGYLDRLAMFLCSSTCSLGILLGFICILCCPFCGNSVFFSVVLSRVKLCARRRHKSQADM